MVGSNLTILVHIATERKARGEVRDNLIDALCRHFQSVLFLLWDGAFSYARTVHPTENDIIVAYQQCVDATVNGHVSLGLTITFKVHLLSCWQKHNILPTVIKGGKDTLVCPSFQGLLLSLWVRHSVQHVGWKKRLFSCGQSSLGRSSLIGTSAAVAVGRLGAKIEDWVKKQQQMGKQECA